MCYCVSRELVLISHNFSYFFFSSFCSVLFACFILYTDNIAAHFQYNRSRFQRSFSFRIQCVSHNTSSLRKIASDFVCVFYKLNQLQVSSENCTHTHFCLMNRLVAVDLRDGVKQISILSSNIQNHLSIHLHIPHVDKERFCELENQNIPSHQIIRDHLLDWTFIDDYETKRNNNKWREKKNTKNQFKITYTLLFAPFSMTCVRYSDFFLSSPSSLRHGTTSTAQKKTTASAQFER